MFAIQFVFYWKFKRGTRTGSFAQEDRLDEEEIKVQIHKREVMDTGPGLDP